MWARCCEEPCNLPYQSKLASTCQKRPWVFHSLALLFLSTRSLSKYAATGGPDSAGIFKRLLLFPPHLLFLQKCALWENHWPRQTGNSERGCEHYPWEYLQNNLREGSRVDSRQFWLRNTWLISWAEWWGDIHGENVPGKLKRSRQTLPQLQLGSLLSPIVRMSLHLETQWGCCTEPKRYEYVWRCVRLEPAGKDPFLAARETETHPGSCWWV